MCSGHKDSVTCTQFSHDGKYVATADMGGLVQVWLATTGELVWSFETDDIEVCIYTCVYSCICVCMYCVNSTTMYATDQRQSIHKPTQWLKWHPGAHVLLVGTTEGNGWMWKIPSGDCKTFQGHGSVNSCAAILNDGTCRFTSHYRNVWCMLYFGVSVLYLAVQLSPQVNVLHSDMETVPLKCGV